MKEKVKSFEDLVAWQKARELTKEIYRQTRQGSFSNDYGLSNQIQRASVSVMSNLAEGFERGSRTEFHQFVVIAKASCAEVRSQLYVALDAGYISQEQFQHLIKLATEISHILGGLHTALQRPKTKPKD